MRRFMQLLAILLMVATSAAAQAACWQWSLTAASNATADPSINWSEGMAPSGVNDSARAMMARLAECRDDISGKLVTTGTGTAYLLTTNQGTIAATPIDGQQVVARVNATNGASPTLAVDGGTAFPIQTAPGTAVASGTLVSGVPYRLTFASSSSAWLIQNYYGVTIPAGSVITSMLANNAVTYAKMQTVTDQRLLGNFSGVAAVPSEYSFAQVNANGAALSTGVAPPSAFKNLVIKVTGNTTLTVAADFVTTTNGTAYQTTPVSCSMNMGSTGALGLDTGVIAAATWYAIWIDTKVDGTTTCTASLQFTANGTFLGNRPSGYTFYARVGAVRTAAGVAQLLGTWQFGRRAQYVIGLAQTTIVPNIANNTAGSGTGATSPTLASVSVANFVPSTASKIHVIATNTYHGLSAASNLYIAPSTSWGGANTGNNGSSSQGWPIYLNSAGGAQSMSGDILLESTTNLAWFSDGAGGGISCFGWEDNI